MKNNLDLSKYKKKSQSSKNASETLRTAISIKLDSETLGEIKIEAVRMGIPYQTLINSILYRYANGELLDKRELGLSK